MRKISIVLAALLAAVMVARSAPADDKKGGTLKGKVTFSGNDADMNKVDATAKDPDSCGPSRPLGKVVVDAGTKGFADVVVYVKGKVAGDFDPKFKKVELDQKGCTFHSHVTFVAAGGDVVFKNSDSVLHNVKFSSTNNGSFNQGIGGGKEQSYTFKEPEFVTCECSVHPWMSGLIVVMENPYYTATNEKGEYELHLPAGKFKIMSQHQTKGKADRKGVQVEIKDGGETTLDFDYKG